MLERDASPSMGSVASERRARETLDVPAPPGRAESLRVDVVDAFGRPAAGVTIACGIVSPSRPAVFDARLRARTDAQGSAWFELSALPVEDSLRMRAEILAEPVPEIVLDPVLIEARHAALCLPPTGTVRLELADGRVAPASVRFAVWARADGSARDVEPLPRRVAAPGGKAVLEHVGTGLELRVAAAIDGDEARAERVVASGPRFAGEERVISVPLGAPWPIVLLRALDEHGNVLRNEILGTELKWSRPEGAPTWSSDASPARAVRTDDEGRARFPLRGRVAGGFTRRLVLTQAVEGADAVARSAERDLSWEVAAGEEIDLGDVELRPPARESAQVWVSGLVEDQAGDPVREATVLVSAIDEEGAPLRGPTAQGTVEPDGRFAVRGPPVEQRLLVRAVAPGFLPSAEQAVEPGASGLSIRMLAAARWAGRLRLDPGIPFESLVVEVITPDKRLRAVPTSERVAVDGLGGGWIDVEVRTRTGDWLVERREQLPTTPAGTEAREEELDLRGRLTRLRLRLASADGTPLGRVFARVHPEPWPESGAWVDAGRLELIVPAAARTITVRPPGLPPLACEPLDGIQELTWPAPR